MLLNNGIMNLTTKRYLARNFYFAGYLTVMTFSVEAIIFPMGLLKAS